MTCRPPRLRPLRQHASGRDGRCETLVLSQILVLEELGEEETHARVRLLPLGSVAAYHGDRRGFRYRVVRLASARTAGAACGVYSTCLRAFSFAFCDANANLVFSEYQADELVVRIGGIWGLEEGHGLVC